MGDEGQQIEQVKDHREGLLAMAIVVFELVPMVFLDIALFIFNLPAGAPYPHEVATLSAVTSKSVNQAL